MNLNDFGRHGVALCLLAVCGCSGNVSAGAGADQPVSPGAPSASVSAPAAIETAAQPIASAPATQTAAPASATPPVASTAVTPAASTPPPVASTTAAPATPPPAGDAVSKGDSILLPGNIVFQSGKAILEPSPGNEAVLEQLKRFLDANQKNVTVMRIEGHTDNVGSPEGNLKLSGERALAIKTALIARGVAAERLMAVGFGANKPIADNSTDAGRAQNRRTEFKIAVLFGKPYRGRNPLAGGTEFK